MVFGTEVAILNRMVREGWMRWQLCKDLKEVKKWAQRTWGGKKKSVAARREKECRHMGKGQREPELPKHKGQKDWRRGRQGSDNTGPSRPCENSAFYLKSVRKPLENLEQRNALTCLAIQCEFYVSTWLGQGTPRYLTQHYVWVCLGGCFQMQLAFEKLTDFPGSQLEACTSSLHNCMN